MNDNEYSYVYVKISIRGKGLIPQEVTNSLGLTPSISFSQGDYRNKTDKWKHNYWSFSSQDKIQSLDLASHLEWIINQIEPVKAKFLEILNKNDIAAEIRCFWILPSDHEALSLNVDLIKKIADLGIKMEIDIHYCP